MIEEDILKVGGICSDAFSPEYFSKDCRLELFDCLKIENDLIMRDSILKFGSEILSLDSFINGNKTKSRCFSGKDMPFDYIMPFLFLSGKEAGYGVRKELRKIQDADVRNIDFSQLYVVEGPENMSKLDILSEIRDAIGHKRLVYNSHGLVMIDNPIVPRKHAYEFKAVVPYQVFLDFMEIIEKYDRRLYNVAFLSKEDLKLKTNTKIEDVLDKGNFYQIMLKESANYPYFLDQSSSDTVDFFKNHPLPPGSIDTKIINLTDNQKKFILDFFSKNKHKFSLKKLHYVATNLIDHNLHEFECYNILYGLWGLKPNETYKDFLNKYFSSVVFDYFIGKIYSQYGGDESKLSLYREIFEGLSHAKQKNGQPLFWHYFGIIKYISDELRKRGFHSVGDVKDLSTITIFKGDTEISGIELMQLASEIAYSGITLHFLFDEFPNRMRLQYIKLVYATILGSTNNSGSSARSGEFSEEERIRDAMIHNQYTHLHGIKDVILRDGYNKKTNSWEWEKVYNINELFEDSRKKLIESIRSKSK